MKEFLIEKRKIFFEQHLDGGGTWFGLDSIKNQFVFSNINKGKILEMCSGPGFMGFYLNFIGVATELFLIDINQENEYYINETIKYNKLTNTKFINSNVFESFNENITFDTIVLNPPHFSKIKNNFNYEKNVMNLNIDVGWQFHKNFFKNVEKFMHQKTKIIIIENYKGISMKEMQNLINNSNLKIEEIISTTYSFFAIILKLKTNDNL